MRRVSKNVKKRVENVWHLRNVSDKASEIRNFYLDHPNKKEKRVN